MIHINQHGSAVPDKRRILCTFYNQTFLSFLRENRNCFYIKKIIQPAFLPHLFTLYKISISELLENKIPPNL